MIKWPDLVAHVDDVVGLTPGDLVLWKVGVHFVSVKIRIVGLANGVVEPHHFLALQDSGPMRHD